MNPLLSLRHAFVPALFASVSLGPLSAAVTSWEITGTFDFPFDPGVDSIISGGETFTLTFDFDDSVAASSSGPGQAAYNALTNLGLVIDDFGSGSYDASGSSAAVDNFFNPGNHQWSIFWFPDSHNIPDVSGLEYDGVDDDLFLASLNLYSLDFEEGLFSSDPPELVSPGELDPDETSFELYWQAGGDPGRMAVALASVDSITLVPEPSAPLLIALSSVLGLARRRRD